MIWDIKIWSEIFYNILLDYLKCYLIVYIMAKEKFNSEPSDFDYVGT